MNNTERQIDEKLSFYVILFFIIQALNGSIKSILPFLDEDIQSKMSLLAGGILLLVMVKSLRYVFKRSHVILVKSYILFLILYFFGIIQSLMRDDPINLLLSASAFWTFVWWLPMGLFVYSIRDKNILYKVLLKGSYILSLILFLSLIPVVLKSSIFAYEKDYNMFFSYMLVFPLLLHLNEYIRGKNKIILIFCIIELFAIVLYGSRGALLCVFSFSMLKIFYGQINYFQKVLIPSVLFTIIILFTASADYFVKVLSEYNLSSRTLEKLAAHDMQGGRDYIWEAGIQLIQERPILGYGLGGEFYQMTYQASEVLGRGRVVSEVEDLTPHNGFLQLMLNFGVFVGLSIGLYILFSILKLKTKDNSHIKDLLIITFSVFIIPAMTVSDGIFIKPGIAIFLYLMINYKKEILYEKVKRISKKKPIYNLFI